MPKFTEQDWDTIRKGFADSIMVNTSINSLAQSLDGPEWPIKGKDETAAKYIELTYPEMIELLALKGQSPERADLLIGILKDTLAFDNPWGDMVVQTEAAEKKDNQLLKNMSRLEIPESFPITLTGLSASTMEFCKLEKLSTLGEFCVFAQNMSQNVIVGGDFRKLLNALSHVDEKTLAECVPFRPGSKGLHLIEAFAQATAKSLPQEHAVAAADWFKDELAALKADLAAGGSLPRQLSILNNPPLEAKVSDLLGPFIGGPKADPAKKTGFFSKFFKK